MFLSPAKILIILVVAMILLGPDKLPQVARQLGAAWRTFLTFRDRMESEVRSQMPDLPSTTEIAKIARSPAAFLNKLAEMPAPDDDTPVPDPAAANPELRPDDLAPWPADRAMERDDAPGTPTPSAAPGTPEQTPAAGLRVPDDPSMN